MSQKPLIIFSSEQLTASAKALKWWWLTLPLFLGLVFASVRAYLPTEYEASTVLAPSEERTGGLAELAGGLSGFAGLAGIDVGGLRLNNTQLAIKVIESRTFKSLLIEKYNLLPNLLAVEGWDKSAQRPIYDLEIYDPESNTWHIEPKPETWYGYGPLNDIIILDNDRTTRILNLSVKHVDPLFATQLVEIIVEEINRYMRARDKEKITRQVDYLTSVANEAQHTEVRESLLYLLQEQFKRQMLVEANKDYVYEIIDPVVVPHKPAGFGALVWFIIGTIIGTFLMLATNILHSYRVANE
ncbi:hypothetical protein ACFOD1_02685 [Pseudidiomarina halophila]|uniref:LPS O-antigen length regulator n=1 Tax=Pseudidiomarina halophila TaxID=1449799 RepID=A0A432XYS1_9GAMM|nr:kelch repeat-containing protein [Pseudidiomarina halophila]RUO53866.1 hypothetical protein CWI69_00020 [Pseudidiomarina halophila]